MVPHAVPLDAVVTGGEPDIQNINWFRISHAKNGVVVTMIDDLKFRGSGGNQTPIADAGADVMIKSDNSGKATVPLDGSASFDPDGSIVKYSWTAGEMEIATGATTTAQLSEGIHYITLIVTDDKGATHDDQITVTVDGGYFDDCDVIDGWQSANPLVLNTTDQVQGLACIESSGSGVDEFKKVFEPVSAAAFRSLEFWYYVSDVSQLDAANQVELGSAGRPDQNEYNWSLSNLKNGWNQITLEFARAGNTGGTPDMQNINFLRLYRFKKGSVVTRIDGLKFGGVNEAPVANAGADQTVRDADGNGKESVTLDASVSSDPDGSIFKYLWTLNGKEIAANRKPTVELSVGTHTITLVVTDNGGATGEDQVTITVQPATGVDDENGIPTEYALRQNHPNPFNPKTTIRYSLPAEGLVQLHVYDILGKEVASLLNEIKPIGHHRVEFEATDLSSGVYYYRLQCNGFVQTKKLVLLR